MLPGQIAGDDSAQHDPGFGGDSAEHGVENRAADVVEIDIDASGAVLLECGGEIFVLVVDTRIEPEVLHNSATLLWPSGDTYHAGPGDLGDLAGDRTGGPRGGRDHDCLTRLRPADVGHAEIRSGAA